MSCPFSPLKVVALYRGAGKTEMGCKYLRMNEVHIRECLRLIHGDRASSSSSSSPHSPTSACPEPEPEPEAELEGDDAAGHTEEGEGGAAALQRRAALWAIGEAPRCAAACQKKSCAVASCKC